MIADSVGSNLVGPMLEEATGFLVVRTRAYTSQDNPRARYKEETVEKVVRRVTKPVHTVILGACSTDVTNLDPASRLEDGQAAAMVASAHATIESAEFLIKSGKAQQVVVLEHNPRYDSKMKAELARLASKSLHAARRQSEHSEHILVGIHSGLEVEGEQRELRFTQDGSNSKTSHVGKGKCDWVHMYSQVGALAFTTSLVGILKGAGLEKGRGRRPAHSPSTSTAGGSWQRVAKGNGRNKNHQQQEAASFQIPTNNRYQGFC